MTHVPFVLSARVRTPVSVKAPIPLEGILYDARFRRAGRMTGEALDCIAYRDGTPAASAGILVCDGFAGEGYDSVTLVKRVDDRGRAGDVIEMDPGGRKEGRRIGQMSPYRPRLADHVLMTGIREIRFLAVGDPDAVLGAMQCVAGVGGLRTRGYGEVEGWRVEEAAPRDVDAFGWFSCGRLLRRLPREIAVDALGGVPDGAYEDFSRVEPPLRAEEGRMQTLAPLLRSMVMSGDEAQAIAVG